jgi:hypothetical protein
MKAGISSTPYPMNTPDPTNGEPIKPEYESWAEWKAAAPEPAFPRARCHGETGPNHGGNRPPR